MLTIPSKKRARTVANGVARHALARARGKNVWSMAGYLITLRCNLRCKYCDFPRHADEELDTEQAKRLLEGLRRSGTFRLSVSGGEPLLRPDMGEVVEHAANLGFITSIVSNAVTLEDRVEDCAKADFFLTTVEGDARSHNKIRGRDMWEKTVRGLEALRRHGGPKLAVICPVHAGNAHVIEEPLRVAEELGMTAFYQPVEMRDGWKGKPFEGRITWEQSRAVFEQITAWKREGRPIGNSTPYLKLMTADHAPHIRELCPAGRYVVTILPDGRVTPCCMVPFEDAVPIEDLDQPQLTHPKLTTPPCNDCTLSPYVESHLLLKPDPMAVWEALAW